MLCAIAIVDPAAADRLLDIGQIAERFGFSSENAHGHITLATYLGAAGELRPLSGAGVQGGFYEACRERGHGSGGLHGI